MPSASTRGAQSPHGSQGIRPDLVALQAADGKPAVNIPGGQPPTFSAAQLSDLGQRVVMFMRFNPDAGEARAHVLRQALRERHRRISSKVCQKKSAA